MAEVMGDLECKPNCDVNLDESPVRKPGSHDRPENILSSGPESSFPATPVLNDGNNDDFRLQHITLFSCALARLPVGCPELVRAHPVQVLGAAGRAARARAAHGFDLHWQVVAVHQADVIEVLGARADRELG
nr:hypothetical protein Iba_chr15eCG2170 [Ipomoea batatas]